MTIPSTGNVSVVSNVAPEIGAGLPLSLLDSRVRQLAGTPSGPVSLISLRGKGSGITATGVNSSNTANSTDAGGTVGCSPAVTNIQGGTAPYSYAWAIVSSSNAPTLSSSSLQTCSVSKTYLKNGVGSASAVLRCTISDSSGKSVVINNITAYLEWMGNA